MRRSIQQGGRQQAILDRILLQTVWKDWLRRELTFVITVTGFVYCLNGP